MPWWVIFPLIVGISNAQIDNGILGEPVVDCGDSFIEVRFDTRTPFRGLVFVEGHLEDPDCRSPPADDNGLRNTSLRLGFEGCDIQKRLSSAPRGLFINTKIIVAFHPEFLSKYDRVYLVQCFYMEMERRLEKQIQISMPPPTMHTAQVPMPVCRYEVLDSGPTGPPVFYTTVGQMVYHKWTCDTEYTDTFCMIVHSCTVDDGNGDRVQLLDEKGCAQDKYLLNNLEYITDLMAGREAHVYKYADRENMYFDCQITLTIKEPGQEYCDYPICPDPPRRRRSHLQNLTEVDVQPSEHQTASLTAGNQTNLDRSEVDAYVIEDELIMKMGFLQKNFDVQQNGFCMSSIGASTVLIFNVGLIIVSTVFMYFTFISDSRK